MATTNHNTRTAANSGINNLSDVHDRVVSRITNALRGTQPVLLEALPGSGKSYGLIKAVAQTNEPVTYLTQRGRKEQYEQVEKWSQNNNLTCKVLPAVDETCLTVQGKYGKEWRDRVNRLREAGASATEIHSRLDPPCQDSGPCPYMEAVDFDPEDYDVLIGHPKHAYVNKYLEDRTPVFDEFPGEEYQTTIGENLSEVVTSFLQSHDSMEFKHYTDVIENRDVGYRQRIALEQLQSIPLLDEIRVFKDPDRRHKLGGLCVLTLLKSEGLDNGWEYAILGEGRIGVFEPGSSTIHILNPPDLPEHVIGLDGTPTKEMWELALGLYNHPRKGLNHKRALTDNERESYVTEIQDIQITPTTTSIRPYSGGSTSPTRDAALLHEIGEETSGKKGVISSQKGLRDLENEFNQINNWETAYYGNILGSNQLGDVDVGVILGSPHYGDEFVEKWAAFAGENAKRGQGKGLDLSYGALGDKILHHMREHQVLQALFRFARQGSQTTVFVDTISLPDWLPVVADPDETSITTWRSASKKKAILDVLRENGKARTKALAEEAECTSQHVRKVLNEYTNGGGVLKQDAPDGRGGAKIWVDQALSGVNPYGEVQLPILQTCFSKLYRYRSQNGSVSKRSPAEEFHNQQSRWTKRVQMERWYWSR